MTPFTSPATIMAMVSFATTCTVKRSTASGGQYGTPAVVASNLSCSHVQEMTAEEREKANLATITQPCRMRTAVPEGDVIQEKDIVVVDGQDYLVERAVPKPARDRVDYYELILEAKR